MIKKYISEPNDTTQSSRWFVGVSHLPPQKRHKLHIPKRKCSRKEFEKLKRDTQLHYTSTYLHNASTSSQLNIFLTGALLHFPRFHTLINCKHNFVENCTCLCKPC